MVYYNATVTIKLILFKKVSQIMLRLITLHYNKNLVELTISKISKMLYRISYKSYKTFNKTKHTNHNFIKS